MNEERLRIFNDYIKWLYGRGVQSTHVGQRIKHVQHFLENSESVTKRGYNLYKKKYACMFVENSVSVAICDFLNFNGVGYSKKNKKTENVNVEYFFENDAVSFTYTVKHGVFIEISFGKVICVHFSRLIEGHLEARREISCLLLLLRRPRVEIR